MRRLCSMLLLVTLFVTLSGCVCRPGYVGPTGGLHPARCYD